mmetsp:Transcript_59569/g.98791  ORF Transcript_59569/g.98791 Transcript_59569/m.98791 type:complete len:90 (-) Transcript_59569:75-344(-)
MRNITIMSVHGMLVTAPEKSARRAFKVFIIWYGASVLTRGRFKCDYDEQKKTSVHVKYERESIEMWVFMSILFKTAATVSTLHNQMQHW